MRLHVLVDASQHAVDKFAGRLAAERLGKFNGFVDGHLGRNLGMLEFVDADAQDIPINGGHLIKRPFRRVPHDGRVNGLLVFENAAHQCVGKSAVFKARGKVREILAHDAADVLGSVREIPLIERLKRDGARKMAVGHECKFSILNFAIFNPDSAQGAQWGYRYCHGELVDP